MGVCAFHEELIRQFAPAHPGTRAYGRGTPHSKPLRATEKGKLKSARLRVEAPLLSAHRAVDHR